MSISDSQLFHNHALLLYIFWYWFEVTAKYRFHGNACNNQQSSVQSTCFRQSRYDFHVLSEWWLTDYVTWNDCSADCPWWYLVFHAFHHMRIYNDRDSPALWMYGSIISAVLGRKWEETTGRNCLMQYGLGMRQIYRMRYQSIWSRQ